MGKSKLYIEAYKNCIAIKKQTDMWISAALIENIEESLQCIFSFFQAEGDVPAELATAFEKAKIQLMAAPSADLKLLQEKTNVFFVCAQNELAKKMYEEVKAAEQISEEDSEMFFDFFEQIPRTTSQIGSLIFMVCEAGSFTNPQKSFDWTMRLFEENPIMLSGPTSAHPGYVYRKSEQRIFDTCPICGGSGHPFHRDFTFFQKDFSYPALPAKLWMHCEECGNLYTWKFQEAYLKQAEYMHCIQPEPEKYWTTVEKTSSLSLALWSEVLERLQKFSDGSTLLEVGVGRGELIAVALELGYDVDAVELNPETAQKAANLLGIPVWNCDFLKYNTEKRYSRIIMGDVIEHVSSPEAALKNAYRLLEEDGVLWVSTPNFESAYSRFLKFDDPMWREPNHISYFSYVGIVKLAEKCGFKAVDYQVSKRYSGSMEVIFVKDKELSEETN